MLAIADISQYKRKEDLYIKVRSAENRVVDDVLLRKLPYADSDYTHYKEWRVRAESFDRFLRYIRKYSKGRDLHILDIGCGNGWMTHRLHDLGHSAVGLDLNLTELEQAERVFGTSDTLQWVYADIIKDRLPFDKFDLIVFGASCQYFNNMQELHDILLKLLSPVGEIHLLDSFFYKKNEISAAALRTQKYYASIGYAEMSDNYFHHSEEQLKILGFKKIYPTLLSVDKNKPQWWKKSYFP